jgi:hypothetical protein
MSREYIFTQSGMVMAVICWGPEPHIVVFWRLFWLPFQSRKPSVGAGALRGGRCDEWRGRLLSRAILTTRDVVRRIVVAGRVIQLVLGCLFDRSAHGKSSIY